MKTEEEVAQRAPAHGGDNRNDDDAKEVEPFAPGCQRTTGGEHGD